MDLREAYDRGAGKHGPLDLPFEVFASRVGDLLRRRLERNGLPPSEGAVADLLARTQVDDLYLSVACDQGVPGAWDRLSARYAAVLKAVACRRGAREGEAEEVSRDVLGDLFAPPPSGGARTRLGTFDGTGSLTAWLGVIVERRLVDRHRSGGPRIAPEAGESALAAAPSREGDPGARASEAESARAFARALERAWGSLTDREALALRLRYRQGLPQTAIARMLRVGEPRVSRLLRAAEEKLRAAVARGADGSEHSEGLRRLLRDSLAERMATSAAPRDTDPEEESRRA